MGIVGLCLGMESVAAGPPKLQLLPLQVAPKPMVVQNKGQDCKADPDSDRDGSNSMQCGGLDCDDSDRGRVPGGVEICDGADRDEDCDPTTGGIRDRDRDGFVDTACKNFDNARKVTAQGNDCDDTRYEIQPGSIRCTSQTDYEYCMADARVFTGKCQAPTSYCAPQPNGLGICIPPPPAQ